MKAWKRGEVMHKLEPPTKARRRKVIHNLLQQDYVMMLVDSSQTRFCGWYKTRSSKVVHEGYDPKVALIVSRKGTFPRVTVCSTGHCHTKALQHNLGYLVSQHQSNQQSNQQTHFWSRRWFGLTCRVNKCRICNWQYTKRSWWYWTRKEPNGAGWIRPWE